MPRRKARENLRAEEIIGDVIQWADRQKLGNIAAELRRALDLLKKERRQ
jgi:hypothetical protein